MNAKQFKGFSNEKLLPNQVSSQNAALAGELALLRCFLHVIKAFKFFLNYLAENERKKEEANESV